MSEARDGLPIVAFADAAAFAAWIEAAPADVRGLWVRFAKKGSGVATLSKPDAIDVALCHGWIDGQLAADDDRHWLVRFTPRKPASRWSAINTARAAALIDAGRMRPAGLAQVRAAQADGRWDLAYAPASRAEVPPDLRAALDACPAAAAFFATLTGANRYAILYRVGAVRTPAARAARIVRFVAMLERGEMIHGAP